MMLWLVSGLVSLTRKEKNEVISNRSIIHRQALASEKVVPILH